MDARQGKLLISVVRRGRGDRVVALAKEAGARGSTVLLGRGTARSRILQILGLADTEKELVFTIAPERDLPAIIDALKFAPDLCVKMPGIGFVLDVSAFFHSGKGMANSQPANKAEAAMQNHELICVIVNSGFAEDIMHVARNAGATGGTIIRARGTGTEKDSSFFGITIVPEKEMLMILVRREQTDTILSAVQACPFLAEPGIGIVFCMPVENFFALGKKANDPDKK